MSLDFSLFLFTFLSIFMKKNKSMHLLILIIFLVENFWLFINDDNYMDWHCIVALILSECRNWAYFLGTFMVCLKDKYRFLFSISSS